MIPAGGPERLLAARWPGRMAMGDASPRGGSYRLRFLTIWTDKAMVAEADMSSDIGGELAWILKSIHKHVVMILLLVVVATAAAVALVVQPTDEYADYTDILIEPEGSEFGDPNESVA
jgi:hypothetical protein